MFRIETSNSVEMGKVSKNIIIINIIYCFSMCGSRRDFPGEHLFCMSLALINQSLYFQQEEHKRNTVGTSLARTHRWSRTSVVVPIMVESQNREHSLETKKPKFKPETIDHISKVAFPVLFIIFNMIYWVYFMA